MVGAVELGAAVLVRYPVCVVKVASWCCVLLVLGVELGDSCILISLVLDHCFEYDLLSMDVFSPLLEAWKFGVPIVASVS